MKCNGMRNKILSCNERIILSYESVIQNKFFFLLDLVIKMLNRMTKCKTIK
jgi:hypothetical protein